ncbi:MAG: phenylalanine--tRNA ligase subunit beta, partial [Ferruginibacter sp.]
MTLSYNWLCNYLPATLTDDVYSFSPERLSEILTAIGLEVESMHISGAIKGGLAGLITGEVISCEKHPGADKLKVAMVDVGSSDYLQIVCGAANIAIGQAVIVAPVNSIIYP